MSNNRINKLDVYNFLNEKKSKLIEEKISSMQEKLQKMKNSHIKSITDEINIDTIYENLANAKKEMTVVRDKLHYHYGLFSEILSEIDRLHSKEQLLESISHAVCWPDVREVDAYTDEIREKKREINEEFYKLEVMVKACSTGNVAVRQLKEIGFDTSSIKSAPKNEVATVNVNKDLLGLPEEK